MFPLSHWRQFYLVHFGFSHFVYTFLSRNFSHSSLLLVLPVHCLQEGSVRPWEWLPADPHRVIFFQSWGLRLTSLNRWAAAVGAVHQTQRARREVTTTAPAARARTPARRLLHSLPSSSPTTAGRLWPMGPAGHREATSSWTPSVSVLSLSWLRAGGLAG